MAEAVRAATGLPAEIKWPNDVVIGRRKLAGILAEAAAQAGTLQHIVLGLRCQPALAAYPAELASRLTSIEAETGRPPDRAQILAEILASIAERYADLRAGRFDAILGAWRRLAPSLPFGSGRVGFARAVSFVAAPKASTMQGALLVRVDGDRIERLIAGEVRWM